MASFPAPPPTMRKTAGRIAASANVGKSRTLPAPRAVDRGRPAAADTYIRRAWRTDRRDSYDARRGSIQIKGHKQSETGVVPRGPVEFEPECFVGVLLPEEITGCETA